MTKIHDAIIFATVKHQNQKRKGTALPYIVHPMEVMQILTMFNCQESVIIAGILHDTLEDTDTKPDEIEKLFGGEVLGLVKAESEDKSKTWKERKQATIDYLDNKASPEAKIICFADKLSNIRSIYSDKEKIGNEIWKRFNADKDPIEWYYREVLRSIEKGSSIEYNGIVSAYYFTQACLEYRELLKVFS